MRLRRLLRLLVPAGTGAIVAAVGLSGVRSSRPAAGPAQASPARAASGPAVALLVTMPGATSTSLHVTRPGDASAGAPLCTFEHVEDAAVQGTVLPGAEIVVLATADTTRDAAFAGSLFRLAEHHPPERLADRIARGGRPLITSAGRVFVSRGQPGGSPEVVHDLTADEIDPVTGAARTRYATRGHLLFLAGAFAREILLYRVGSLGADLAAVDADSGAVRVVCPDLSPYARDFSVDEAAGALVFQARSDVDARAFIIERVDLATGARRRLYAGQSPSLAPFAWPGGGVAYTHEGRAGLALLGSTRPLAAAPLGPGVDRIQATAAGGAWVAGVHTGGDGARAFAVDTRTGAAEPLPSPRGARAYVAGFPEDRRGVATSPPE